MSKLIETFVEKKHDWINSLLEHIQISLMSLLIAIIIAIPLAILLSQSKKISEIILQITGMLQTIPSLALLGLFIPIFGIGRVPAIIALVIYAIFPILQNTITGLNEIDPSLKEAATAFGMNKFEKLKKFELPLAMPIIISGIRTSTVLIIGTATLASLIGAGGLGTFILLGIDRNNSSLILIGAITSALLAILFNFGIKILEKRRLKTIIISFISMVLLLVISNTGNMKMGEDRIVIAGKLGSEPDILINMYKDLIEENSNIKVDLKPNFGKTTFLYEALKKGDIDIYPEFTGTITSSLLQSHPKISNDKESVYNAAKEGIYNQDKLVLLEPMLFQDTYALAVPEKIAKENNLTSISDLKRVENKLIAGFTLEFNDREDGNKGLKSIYNLNLNVKTMEASLRYGAIEKGDIQIMDAYSTDGQIKKYNLKILKDDKNMFPAYQGAPLIREEILKKYPELKEILEKLANRITEDEMIEMNYKVTIEGKDASIIAREYLKNNGLIK